MKKKYLLLEFLVVFVFLVLPPLFVNEVPENSISFKISLGFIFQSAIALLLQYQHLHFFSEESTSDSLIKKETSATEETPADPAQEVCSENRSHSPLTGTKKTLAILKWAPLTLGLLMVFYAATAFLSLKFPEIFAKNSTVDKPGNFAAWGSAVIQLIFAAVYEEVIYRQFLPHCLVLFSAQSRKFNPKLLSVFLEVLVILTFAFSHRYLGWAAVINAAAAGTVLRLCRIKTGSIYTGSAVHFCYNLCLFIFSVLIA